jgi:diaminopimelate decarboxylase
VSFAADLSDGRPPAFTYREIPKNILRRDSQSHLCCDSVPIEKLAERYGTPLYVYSASTIRERLRTFQRAFRRVPHTVCYSVKANSNLSILKLLHRLGCGFDVVSAGELARVTLAIPRAHQRVVFSGVGKTAEEISAALKAGILLFNIESESELALVAQCAAKIRKPAKIALRVNPDVPADTHPYISTGLHQHKFGVPLEDAIRLYAVAAKARYLQVAGVSVHIGSQITDPEPFASATARAADLVRQLRSHGHRIQFVDAGGGLGIPYQHGESEPFSQYIARYAEALMRHLRGLKVHLLLEPGRAIVGPAGALITAVHYKKKNHDKRFLVVDAAMNDLLRPSLYGAHHEIVPVLRSRHPVLDTFDVVGPICESGDFLARDRQLPEVPEGALLAVLDVGAYGMALSSNYNTRPRAAELLVDGKSVTLIRRRESLADLVKPEII